MAKKYVLLAISIALVVVIVSFSLTGASENVVLSSHDSGVVDKARGDDFTAKITFKNTGKTEGNWSVSAVFEGEAWVWKGLVQNLTLGAGATKTLVWNGTVPNNATINSVARLVVYYNDSFKALDWWIHVVPCAELTIQSSSVQ
jgi:hypothetical protein